MSVLRESVRSWWPLVALVAVLAVSLGLACNGNGGTERTIVITFSTPTVISAPSPTATPTSTPTATPTPSPDVCGANPDPAPSSVLQIEQPGPGEQVRNPFHVRGWGSEIGFEGTGVAVALIDASGDPFPPVAVPPQPRAGRVVPAGLKVTEFTAPFGVDWLVKDLTTATPYCVWVYLEAPEGIPKQVAQVSIVVAP